MTDLPASLEAHVEAARDTMVKCSGRGSSEARAALSVIAPQWAEMEAEIARLTHSEAEVLNAGRITLARAERAEAERDALKADLAETMRLLKDPAAVLVNYLRGGINCDSVIADARAIDAGKAELAALKAKPAREPVAFIDPRSIEKLRALGFAWSATAFGAACGDATSPLYADPPADPEGLGLPPIATDEHDPTREYIPLPGGWEMQTKGRGSSYRLCDTKTGERHMILCNDDSHARDFVTRMAREIHAAVAAPKHGATR